MRQAWRAGIVSTAVLLAVAACAMSPAVATAPTTAPPSDVQAMLAWLMERTMSCIEVPASDDQRRWTCTGTSAWSPGLADKVSVSIDSDGQRATRIGATLDATQTVGHQLCPGSRCDAYIGFFGDTVAHSPLIGGNGVAIGAWVEARNHIGGTTEINGYAIAFDAALPVMSMTVELPSAR